MAFPPMDLTWLTVTMTTADSAFILTRFSSGSAAIFSSTVMVESPLVVVLSMKQHRKIFILDDGPKYFSQAGAIFNLDGNENVHKCCLTP